MYAAVVVDVPELGALDYKVPSDFLVAAGDRVLVCVQTRKAVGIVVALKGATDVAAKKMRSILHVFKDIAPFSSEWLSLTKFAADYYQRGWGEAAVPAIPAVFRRAPTAAHARRLEKFRSQALTKNMEKRPAPPLNAEQSAAAEAVKRSDGFARWLLYGVTGSGKTEVYLNLIDWTLKKDPEAQVLLMVPEINLTPQLEDRVRARFPDVGVATLHSEFSENARAAGWLAVHEGRARILVGTRLSIFASFRKLSLILVDEEHDLSYKAGDGLRFSARDLAVWRAKKNNCPVVLGSATPSLESWAKAKAGDYSFLAMRSRAAAHAALPSLEVIPPKPRGSAGLVSDAAYQKMTQVLEAGRQVMVFLNRRGYSPVISCPACDWVSACRQCSAFMVFHKAENALVCHHCGSRRPVPAACPVCGNVDILPRGTGTERVEEELQLLFPGRRILRIDRDSAASRKTTDEAFRKVHRGEVDILLGTQMIAKGHDFQNVALVLVLNADTQMLMPSPRAKEHLFATLMQVSGRAGRGGGRGLVLIQTRFPEDALFSALKNQNYEEYADGLLEERRADHAVPYMSQALLFAESDALDKSLCFLSQAADLGVSIGMTDVQIFDPVPMNLVKLKNRERGQLLVESESRLSLNKFLARWRRLLPSSGDVHWVIEVDPIDT